MAKSQFIAPFPAGIDRHYFGHYIAGFSDGEACFNLYYTSHQTPGAAFTIALRRDDTEILNLLQSYWGCGRIYRTIRNRNDKVFFVTQFSIYVVPDLARVVIPHFEKFPLRAKKAGDFRIWKEAVALICSRERRGKDSNGQFGKRWTDEEKAQFATIYASLQSYRQFLPPSE